MDCKNIDSSSTIYRKNFKFYDIILKSVVIFSAVLVIGVFLSIVIYILANGFNYITVKFIFNTQKDAYKGVLPIIINTLYVQVLSILIATPIGVGTAIYLTQYKDRGRFVEVVNFLTNVLASIPSILIGLFGFNLFCIIFGLQSSILVGCLTLIFCILPTIISTTREALLSVPVSYKQGALALGAGKLKVIFGLILPCAMPGIVTAVILAAGRVAGESAALLLTVGTGTKMPAGLFEHIFESGRTLTLHIYLTAGNAICENSVGVCFAVATILIIFIFILNCLTKLLILKFKK